ncbi:hypothetical protein HZB69_00015 [Candidatus Amesbacteria bacterium]|nr:hypothetical protein [Candidatus Amesbacteria bacterium]
MPKPYLKAVINANGGLENFCFNVLFDPNAQNQTKTVLIDQELKTFLNKNWLYLLIHDVSPINQMQARVDELFNLSVLLLIRYY